MKQLLAYATIVALIMTTTPLLAQDELPEDIDLYELSLEELLNLPINSASKKEETLFEAPLSSSTVTKAEIEKSGVTTIMEALRLVPGLIVREQSNGVYDIHIRGLDNLLRYSQAFDKNNMFTLVMIDSRPAFNHNLGGTFWEALPIDLMDVDRIEVVRGPSAPLFGPNAVTGVVNIITKRANSRNTIVSANVEGGAPTTVISNVFVGKKFSNKFNSAVSFNYQNRSRYDNAFYNSATGEYESGENFINNFSKYFPNKDQAVRKFGVNGFLQYSPAEKVNLDLSMGYQNNEALKNMLASYGTILNNSISSSFYTNLAAKISKFSLRTSFINGKDDIKYGSAPSKYDYHITDINAEYTIDLGKNVDVVPGFNYQEAVYSDETYFAEEGEGFLNGTKQSISTASAFLRSDINLTTKWRVLAALRLDKFSTPDDVYLAYEFASTYKLNDNNLIRVAVTRSNSGAFMGYNKLNYRDQNSFNLGNNYYIDEVQRGSNDLNLLTVEMIEVGYRTKLSSNLQLDIDVFHQHASNLTTGIAKGFSNYPNVPASDFVVEFDNVPTTATQIGTTIGLNYIPNSKWQIKPFITIQSTETKNLADIYLDPELSTSQPGVGFSDVTYSNSKHTYTPGVFGGYYINFKPNDKFNVNMNGYFTGDQTWHRDVNTTVQTDAIFLVNMKLNYAISKKMNIYINGRNILNNQNPQFLGGDRLGSMFLGGFSFNLK
jgi:iron complex outermembrane recepter protein